MLEPDVIVQELYRRYGIVAAKDDPVVATVIMHRLIAEDDEQRQQTWVMQCCAEIDATVRQAQADGREAGAEQFAAKQQAFFKGVDDKTAELCAGIAAQGDHMNQIIKETAASIAQAGNRDELAAKIEHIYVFVRGIYWCLLSLVALGGIGVIGKVRGWF